MITLDPLLIAIIVIVVLVVLFSVTCIKIVPQAEAAIVERLGSYLDTWNNGLHVKVPFIDRVRPYISLKEQVFDFPPQPVITKDNVTMSIDSVVFFRIMDPKLYTYGVESPILAIENLSRHHAAQHHRRLGPGHHAHLARHHQREDARHPGRGHGRLGHQGEPGGGEEHHAAPGHPAGHGEADEGRAGEARGGAPGRGREAGRHPHGRGREGVADPSRADGPPGREGDADPRRPRARPRPS